MPDTFEYDVFLSHSAKDKPIVRDIAERLKRDGVRVWLDEWETKPGDDIHERIEHGLQHSRVLILCMSANALGSDWALLESQTLRFRDPLNQDRRFIPLRLDNVPLKGSLAHFLSINWHRENREAQCARLIEAVNLPQAAAAAPGVQAKPIAEAIIELDLKLPEQRVNETAFTSDGKFALTCGWDGVVRLWDLTTRHCLRVFEGHTENQIWGVEWSADRRRALSGAADDTARVWDVDTGECLRVLKGHKAGVYTPRWSPDQRYVVTGSRDRKIRLWDVETGRCLRVFEGHSGDVVCVAWSGDQLRILSTGGKHDSKIRLWDVDSGRCLQVYHGHAGGVFSAIWHSDRRQFLSCGDDKTVRLWDLESGRCTRVFEGHTEAVTRVNWSPDHRHVLSGSSDGTVRLWDVEKARCLSVLRGHERGIYGLAWSSEAHRVYSGDGDGVIRIWGLSEFMTDRRPQVVLDHAQQVQYTNAKVLLVGESGVGKTGLSKRLALNNWQPSDSTVGAWATHWKLPVDAKDGVEREIWLWDFGGQADQRLIHQLYMDETALAVLVFDGQKEDLFETLGQWDRDLTRAASNKDLAKILTAGRVDAGGLRAGRSQIEAFMNERGYSKFLETSAKTNLGCDELKEAILNGIPWEDIPWRSSPLLFKRLREEIIRLKDSGRVLMRFNELRDTLRLQLAGEDAQFRDEELKAVIGLLAGPGVVWELKFGHWVLLQPERINAYAQAVIQTMREDKYERGCISEHRALDGDLTYHSSVERLEGEEERFVLLAMHQILVERGLCLREQTDQGAVLIFPSYYRRERPELIGHPAVLVSYRFNGFLDDIYATLVVRLHHTKPFEQDQLWRHAADFKTLSGKQLGVKLTRRAEGAGELEVYFDPEIPVEEKIIFSKYVHEHLLQNATDVVRLRHYVCPHCGTPVGNRDVAMRKLNEGKKNILCVNCDDPTKRIPLWDQMEELFASEPIKQTVHELQEQSAVVLDNESKDRALVGEVMSTVALAAQISREFNVSDHGIDMELEFKSDVGEATGRKLYLQLKSGDSYLRERKGDGAEIFRIKDERHAHYWMEQGFPVLLVIRTSDGEVRWMEIREYLKRESEDGKKPVRQIIFKGERFDVMSVRRWREKVLKGQET